MCTIGVLERLYVFFIEFSNIVMCPINVTYQLPRWCSRPSWSSIWSPTIFFGWSRGTGEERDGGALICSWCMLGAHGISPPRACSVAQWDSSDSERTGPGPRWGPRPGNGSWERPVVRVQPAPTTRCTLPLLLYAPSPAKTIERKRGGGTYVMLCPRGSFVHIFWFKVLQNINHTLTRGEAARNTRDAITCNIQIITTYIYKFGTQTCKREGV